MATNEQGLKDALKFLMKEIKAMSEADFLYNTIVVPRAEADKKILSGMSASKIQIDAILSKIKNKEEVTDEEIVSAIPEQFR